MVIELWRCITCCAWNAQALAVRPAAFALAIATNGAGIYLIESLLLCRLGVFYYIFIFGMAAFSMVRSRRTAGPFQCFLLLSSAFLLLSSAFLLLLVHFCCLWDVASWFVQPVVFVWHEQQQHTSSRPLLFFSLLLCRHFVS